LIHNKRQQADAPASGRVVRFPRTLKHQEETELIRELDKAHRRGDRETVKECLIKLQRLNASTIADDSRVTWDTVPRFDPDQRGKTKWLIENFLAEASVQLLFGEAGSYKSTLCLFAAIAVMQGSEFLGMKVRQRRVLLLDFENPAPVIRDRCRNLGLDLNNARDLVIWDRFADGFVPHPDNPILEELVKECLAKTGQAPWIIFDSWSSLLAEGKGGETLGDVAPIYASFRRLSDLGATCTILDHTKKYENTLYGAADKTAKADSRHGLTVFDNPLRRHNKIVRVDTWLKRFALKGDGSFAFEVVSTQDKNGIWHVTGLRTAEDPVKLAAEARYGILRGLIRRYPNASQSQLAKLAAETDHFGRDEAIKELQAGEGTHWNARVGAHGKKVYRLQ
jgi:hypothetical protein